MVQFTSLAELTGLPDRSPVSVRARLRHLQLKETASGERWASLVIDEPGTYVTCLVLPQVYAVVPSETWREGSEVVITGMVSTSNDMRLRLVVTTIAADIPAGP